MDHNDSFLVIGTSRKQLLIYELYSFLWLMTIPFEEQIMCLSIVSDKIILGLGNGDIPIYDCHSFINEATFNGQQYPVWCALKLGERICGVYSSREIYIWSFSSQALLFTLNGHSDDLFCYTSLSDRWLVTGGWDCNAMLWDVENGFLACQFSDHSEAVSCVKMKDHHLITGSFDGNVRIFDWQQSILILTLVGSKEIYCLEISKLVIIAAGSDSHIFVWNWDGLQLFKMAGHLGIIRHVKLLNDNRLVSAGDMRRIMVWDVVNGFCENVLYRNPLQIGKFLANDFLIMVASDNPTPHICVLSFL